MRALVTLLAVAALLDGCKKPPEDTPPAPLTVLPRDGRLGFRRCSAAPGPKNKLLPVLQRPFDNQYPVIYLFDHLTPGDYKPYDPAARELSYCGVDMLGLQEGNSGYTWSLPLGTPILSAADGEVVFAGVEPKYFCTVLGRFVDAEQVVTVRHEGLGGIGFSTVYRSLSKTVVKVGDKVKAGQRLGVSGQSGCVSEPLFLFEGLRRPGTKNGKPALVDPFGWDGPKADPWALEANGAESLYLWIDGEAPTLGGR